MNSLLRVQRMAADSGDQRYWLVVFLGSLDLVCLFEWGDSFRSREWVQGIVWFATSLTISVLGFRWPYLKGRWLAVSRNRQIVAVLGALLLAAMGVYGIHRYSSRRPSAIKQLGRPAPPSFLAAGIGSGPLPVTMSTGRVVRIPPTERPCTQSAVGYGRDGLENLPGGADLKRPRLLLDVDRFAFTEWSDKFDDVFFEVDVTNRGETSITKNWRLCLAHGKEPLYFDAQVVNDPQFQPDIAKATFTTSIEHGHVARGWLRFHVPKEDFTLANFTGSIQCRDYLERVSLFAFAPTTEVEKQPPISRQQAVAPQPDPSREVTAVEIKVRNIASVFQSSVGSKLMDVQRRANRVLYPEIGQPHFTDQEKSQTLQRLHDELLQEAQRDVDRGRSELVQIQPQMDRAVSDAIAEMASPGLRQLTRNEVQAEKDRYQDALKTANADPDLTPLGQYKDVSNNFDVLTHYLEDLHTKLGNYPEKSRR